jgi:PhnB protein
MAKKKARSTKAKKRPQVRKPPARAKPTRTRDGGPAGWPTLSPYMTVRNGQKSVEFYASAFGFKSTGMLMRNDAGEVEHAGMVLGEAAIMFGPEASSMGLRVPAQGGPDSLSLYVYVPEVDKVAARAERAGAQVVAKPADQMWGDRTAVFKDLDGYHWTFATHLGQPGSK